METDNLKKAISQLPQYKAPDVWGKIKSEIPRKSPGKLLFFFTAAIIGCSVVAGLLLSTPETILSSECFQARTPNRPLMRYVKDVEEPETAEVILKFNKSNKKTEISTPDTTAKLQTIPQTSNEIAYETPPEPPSFYHIITSEKIKYEETGSNLITNGDFEEYVFCPAGFTERPVRKLIPYWEVPSKGTPDYFNVCSKRDAGVPKNFAGRIFAHSGSGYAGLILRSSFTNENKITGVKPLDYREYIQAELNETLVRGKKYKIQFWVCNSSGSRYAVDAVGAVLTRDKIKAENDGVLDYTPVIKNSRNNMLVNQSYWVAIEGVYEAKGGEKFLTIGNFNYNFATLYIMMDPSSKFNYAYYYIDDVVVVEVIETLETEYIILDSTVNVAQTCSPQ